MDRHNHQTRPDGASPPGTAEIAGGLVRIVLALVIIELTLSTANIHLGLGGQLFTLNGLGYLGLAVTYAIGALVPLAFVQRFAWLPRIGLAGFTLTTIVAYLVIGPYFALGWITKGIELAIVALLVTDVLVVYGGPRELWRAALATFDTARPPSGPRHA
jgi:hypothetical protein